MRMRWRRRRQEGKNTYSSEGVLVICVGMVDLVCGELLLHVLVVCARGTRGLGLRALFRRGSYRNTAIIRAYIRSDESTHEWARAKSESTMSVAEKTDFEKWRPLTLLRPGSLSLALGSGSLGGSFLWHSDGVERGGGFGEGGR